MQGLYFDDLEGMIALRNAQCQESMTRMSTNVSGKQGKSNGVYIERKL